MLFFLVAVIALALDQLTKRLVLVHLSLHQYIPLGILDIRYVQNSGAAFGMLARSGSLFIVIAVGVLGALLASLPRIRRAGPLVATALGLIAGGTVGNLIDRLRFGYVVDFIDLRWWPVFNVADSCICIGVGLLVWRISRAPQAPAVAVSVEGAPPVLPLSPPLAQRIDESSRPPRNDEADEPRLEGMG